jgi:superfamily II DNA helicase RecQ
MELRIFTLPFDEVSEGFSDEIVTHFCLNKKVHSIRPHFFEQDGRAFWSIAIAYEVVLKGEEKIRSLDEEQQQLYTRLREWRKEQASKDGLPAYLIATNTQLLQMVQLKCRTLDSFKPIKGFGKMKTDKYGRYIVNLVRDFYEPKEKAKQALQEKIESLPF